MKFHSIGPEKKTVCLSLISGPNHCGQPCTQEKIRLTILNMHLFLKTDCSIILGSHYGCLIMDTLWLISGTLDCGPLPPLSKVGPRVFGLTSESEGFLKMWRWRIHKLSTITMSFREQTRAYFFEPRTLKGRCNLYKYKNQNPERPSDNWVFSGVHVALCTAGFPQDFWKFPENHLIPF